MLEEAEMRRRLEAADEEESLPPPPLVGNVDATLVHRGVPRPRPKFGEKKKTKTNKKNKRRPSQNVVQNTLITETNTEEQNRGIDRIDEGQQEDNKEEEGGWSSLLRTETVVAGADEVPLVRRRPGLRRLRVPVAPIFPNFPAV